MANPRNTVEFEGINARYATYKIDASTITYDATQSGGSSAVGKAVTLSAARTVALAADGVKVKGKLISVEADNKCTIQEGGYCALPGGASATLTLGKAIVGAVDGSSNPGFVREVATGTAAELGRQIGCIVDASVTTAVIVDLG